MGLRNTDWTKVDFKAALERLRADMASGKIKPAEPSLASVVEADLPKILEHINARRSTIKDLAEAMEVSPKRLAEAITRAWRKHQGLTVLGKPRRNRKWDDVKMVWTDPPVIKPAPAPIILRR